jgi:hypothetical protein
MTKHSNKKLSVLIGMCLLLSLVLTSGNASSTTPEPFETRCGWFSNPTPANASLYDREDEWIIAVQGGHQADGDWPEFGKGQWVETNGHHGYGCACMQVNVDRNEHKVVKILSAQAKALSACRKDASLKRWKEFK